MDTPSVFSVLAFFFSFSAYVPYTKAVFRGHARPTISSWISWEMMDLAIFMGMFAKHVVSWQILAYLIGVLFVLGACIKKKAQLDWSSLDSFCIVMVSISIVMWARTGDSDMAVIISLIAIALGSIPMWVNLWKNPARDPLLPWLLFLVGGIFAVLAITSWTIAGALAPGVFLLLQTITVLLIARKFFRSTELQIMP